MINNKDFYEDEQYIFTVCRSPRIPLTAGEKKEAERLLTWYQKRDISFWLLRNKNLYIQFPNDRKDTDPALIAQANRDGVLIRRLLIWQRHIIEEFSCSDKGMS
jgi:hypothetical protein